MASRNNKLPGDVRIESQRATTARGMRNPTLEYRGTGLKPMTLKFGSMLPVLAGDTLKAGSVMGRIVGKPTTTDAGAVTGSWFEHWLFYVRIGDLALETDAIRSAIAGGDPTKMITTTVRSDVATQIVKAFFADEDEVVSDGLNRILRWPGTDYLDSAVATSSLPAADTIPGDWEDNWAKYQAMRRARLTTNTWEEYLAKQGVAVPPQLRVEHDPEMKLPELLQFTREFAYPQPTMAPSGASLAHSVQWFIQDRLKRGRFFAEPGFIVPCWAVRPKVILAGPSGATDDASEYVTWQQLFMPVEYETDPHTSLNTVPGALFSPSGDTVPASGSYTMDVRDFLLNGNDFHEGAGVATVRTPDRRPTSAQVTALPTYTADFHWRFSIASRVHRDTTF